MQQFNGDFSSPIESTERSNNEFDLPSSGVDDVIFSEPVVCNEDANLVPCELPNSNGESINDTSPEPVTGEVLNEEVNLTSTESIIDNVNEDVWLASPEPVMEEVSNNEDSLLPGKVLYPGVTLSIDTSNLLIRSYMCRYHLTHRAKAHLLELLQIHLPKPNELSSSLHYFQKVTTDCRSLEFEPAVTEHRFCFNCNTLIYNSESSTCSQPQCGMPVSFKSAPYLMTVSIADQLRCFLRSK